MGQIKISQWKKRTFYLYTGTFMMLKMMLQLVRALDVEDDVAACEGT